MNTDARQTISCLQMALTFSDLVQTDAYKKLEAEVTEMKQILRKIQDESYLQHKNDSIVFDEETTIAILNNTDSVKEPLLYQLMELYKKRQFGVPLSYEDFEKDMQLIHEIEIIKDSNTPFVNGKLVQAYSDQQMRAYIYKTLGGNKPAFSAEERAQMLARNPLRF